MVSEVHCYMLLPESGNRGFQNLPSVLSEMSSSLHSAMAPNESLLLLFLLSLEYLSYTFNAPLCLKYSAGPLIFGRRVE
jgi:hypothetical protein